jgi:hypothetical protein
VLENPVSLDFELYCRIIVTKNSVEAAQKHKEEWNQIQDPDIDHHSDSYFIFDKGDKNTHWRKDSLFDK